MDMITTTTGPTLGYERTNYSGLVWSHFRTVAQHLLPSHVEAILLLQLSNQRLSKGSETQSRPILVVARFNQPTALPGALRYLVQCGGGGVPMCYALGEVRWSRDHVSVP